MAEIIDWLTTAEAARYLKVNPETLRTWARSGMVTAPKLGNRGGFRFSRKDLDRFMRERAGFNRRGRWRVAEGRDE